MRKLAAIVVAALVLFFWGFVSHTVIGLGDAGLESVPPSADAAFAGLPAQGMTESGYYMFPSMPAGQESDPTAQAAWTKQALTQPSGVIVYFPKDRVVMGPATFGIEILTCLALSAIALWLLSCAAGCCTTLVARVGFVAILGALAAIARDVRFWNWYGHPSTFTVAQLVDSIIGMTLVGIVLALIARKDLDAACEGD